MSDILVATLSVVIAVPLGWFCAPTIWRTIFYIHKRIRGEL
jgi:ABC-type spermidine/putrescine transport system permease subunit II